MTLKLLLRCMHHFLFLMPSHLVAASKGEPHSLNGIGPTTSSGISSVLMAQRVISGAFLTLLLSLPRYDSYEIAKVARCFTVLLIDLRVRVVVDCVVGLLAC